MRKLPMSQPHELGP